MAACGLAAGMPLNTTVAPFILRGVTLAGVDSVFMPTQRRLEVYRWVSVTTLQYIDLICPRFID